MLNLIPEARKAIVEEQKLFQLQQKAMNERDEEEESDCKPPKKDNMFV